MSVNEPSGNKVVDKVAQIIIQNMPDWQPDAQHGKNAAVNYTIDIVF